MNFVAPAAGKTGTTDDYTDAWFIGSYRAVCARSGWIRHEAYARRGMTGAKVALPIWTDFMKEYVSLYGV